MTGIIIASLFVILILIITIRTIIFNRGKQDLTGIPGDFSYVDEERAVFSLSEAIRFKTISYDDEDAFDYGEFTAFLDFLENRYPLVNRTCTSRRLNQYSVLYHWKGSDPALSPLLLLGHYDVVPVETGTENQWKEAPFEGTVKDGQLWGRGSLDMKVQIISHLEAAEQLIAEGFTPQRDIWFSYNFDEEQRGTRGATGAVEFFKEEGIRFDTVFDEGGCIVQGALPGVEPPVAIIGLGEKGYANIRIKVKGEGGHSSMPPKSTSLGKLSRIIKDIEDNPMPARLTEPVKDMLLQAGPEMSLINRIALSNLFLFKPLLMGIFSKNPKTNAMIRTSFSATVARAGDAPNVLPLSSEAVINCRPLPGDSIDEILDHLNGIARKSCPSEEFELDPFLRDEASTISPYKTEQFERIQRTIKHFYPQVLVSPYLMMGGSDSSKFTGLSDNVYRFMPILISNEELGTMHNSNERISVPNIARSVAFFKKFITDYQ